MYIVFSKNRLGIKGDKNIISTSYSYHGDCPLKVPYFPNSSLHKYFHGSIWIIIIPRLCTDLLAFILQLRKLQKISAWRQSMKAVWPVIASNGISLLQMKLLWLHSAPGREEEGEDYWRISSTFWCKFLKYSWNSITLHFVHTICPL